MSEPQYAWWVGLDRDALRREINARADEWQKKAIGPLDHVGEKLRDSWTPASRTYDPRGPIR